VATLLRTQKQRKSCWDAEFSSGLECQHPKQ
jgi:hypothetical protein